MKKTNNTITPHKRRISSFAENLLSKYGIKDHDIRLSWVFDEKALIAVTNNTHSRKMSAGLDAPPRLNLIGS